jgi:branched-chain amino acid aminotransferase
MTWSSKSTYELGGLLWLNGQVQASENAQLSVSDRGFTLADGIFETILIEAGKPVWWQDHWDRLCAGAALLQITLPYTQAQLSAGLQELLSLTQLPHRCVLRLTLTRGVANYRGLWNPSETQHPTVLMTLNPWSAMPAQRLIVSKKTRRNGQSPLSAVKSLAYADHLIARQEALAQGATEAVLLDTQSRIACTTVGNLFVELDGCWCTPALNCGVLPGIARKHIVPSLHVQELALTEQDLARATRAFISNSLGITEVASIHNRSLAMGLPAQVQAQDQHLFDALEK